MTNIFYTDFWLMVDDIREHAKNNGRAIVEENVYYSTGKVQMYVFKCSKTQKQWKIARFNASWSTNQLNYEQQRLCNLVENGLNFLIMLNSKGLENFL